MFSKGVYLEGKTAVITGGSSGIGKEITLILAKNGVNTAICSIDDEKLLQMLKKELVDIYPKDEKQHFLIYKADIRSKKEMQTFRGLIRKTFSKIDILVANAGTTDKKHHPILELEYKLWKEIIDINLNGTFITIKTFLQDIISTRGNIVVITSLLGQKGHAVPNDAAYCSSKFGIEGLKEVLAKEMEFKGVNVNSLYPGTKVRTNFFNELPIEEQQKLEDPSIIEDPLIFLVSLLPGEMTGKDINVKKWLEDVSYREGFKKYSSIWR